MLVDAATGGETPSPICTGLYMNPPPSPKALPKKEPTKDIARTYQVILPSISRHELLSPMLHFFFSACSCCTTRTLYQVTIRQRTVMPASNDQLIGLHVSSPIIEFVFGEPLIRLIPNATRVRASICRWIDHYDPTDFSRLRMLSISVASSKVRAYSPFYESVSSSASSPFFLSFRFKSIFFCSPLSPPSLMF